MPGSCTTSRSRADARTRLEDLQRLVAYLRQHDFFEDPYFHPELNPESSVPQLRPPFANAPAQVVRDYVERVLAEAAVAAVIEASIVIPVLDKLEFTRQCLDRIWRNTGTCPVRSDRRRQRVQRRHRSVLCRHRPFRGSGSVSPQRTESRVREGKQRRRDPRQRPIPRVPEQRHARAAWLARRDVARDQVRPAESASSASSSSSPTRTSSTTPASCSGPTACRSISIRTSTPRCRRSTSSGSTRPSPARAS